MEIWLDANPQKTNKMKNFNRFVVNWINKNSNKNTGQTPPPQEYNYIDHEYESEV